MDQMIEEKVRERAYALWEKEGSPSGRDMEFWERARQLVEATAHAEPATPLQQRTEADRAEDSALEATFPASDPPALTRASAGSGRSRKKAK